MHMLRKSDDLFTLWFLILKFRMHAGGRLFSLCHYISLHLNISYCSAVNSRSVDRNVPVSIPARFLVCSPS